LEAKRQKRDIYKEFELMVWRALF